MVVNGYVDWIVLAYSLLWVGGFLLSSAQAFLIIAVGFMLFFFLRMGSFYWIQHNRFSKVATLAAETWSRKYSRDGVDG